MSNTNPNASHTPHTTSMPKRHELVELDTVIDFEADLEQELARLEVCFASYITRDSLEKSTQRRGSSENR